MEKYIGIIYYTDGTKSECCPCSGPSAQKTCEIDTARKFEFQKRNMSTSVRRPTRYEVKKIG